MLFNSSASMGAGKQEYLKCTFQTLWSYTVDVIQCQKMQMQKRWTEFWLCNDLDCLHLKLTKALISLAGEICVTIWN